MAWQTSRILAFSFLLAAFGTEGISQTRPVAAATARKYFSELRRATGKNKNIWDTDLYGRC